MQASIKYIKFSLVFLPVHFLSFYIGQPLPLALIYGPLIYAIVYEIPIKTFFYHLLIPVFFISCFLLNLCGVFKFNNWSSLSSVSIYYLLTAISMIIYFIAISLKNEHQKTPYSVLKNELLLFLKFIYCIGTTFTAVLFFKSINLIDNLGFNPLFLINLLIGSGFFIGVYYLIESRKEDMSFAAKYPTVKETCEILEQYEKELNRYFSDSKLFLEPHISLELLSEKTQIPKHHLSRLFKLHMGKNFYQVISEHRINYATERLKEDNNLTIESLAYECGFNSKSTFNKYFKEYTHYSPSEYRLSFLNFS